jgi:acetyltransferase EpsM
LTEVIIIGYSGHAFVAIETFAAMGVRVLGYCDKEEKPMNPYDIRYLGSENDESVVRSLRSARSFVAIGDNSLRKRVMERLLDSDCRLISAVHPSSVVSPSAQLGEGSLIGAAVVVNALSVIGKGTICNSGCIIEHQCVIEDYAHVAPGATLAGNVRVGILSFIGANAVIREGVTVASEVKVGAGSVVLGDIATGMTVVGNPAKAVTR